MNHAGASRWSAISRLVDTTKLTLDRGRPSHGSRDQRERSYQEAARRLFVWIERLPQFDFVAVGIVYPGEAAVAFVLALRVDADAFFR